jgi:hypothetical protein
MYGHFKLSTALDGSQIQFQTASSPHFVQPTCSCVRFHSDISKVHIYTAESLPTKVVLETDVLTSKSTDVSFLKLKVKTIPSLQFTGVQNIHKMRTLLGYATFRKGTMLHHLLPEHNKLQHHHLPKCKRTKLFHSATLFLPCLPISCWTIRGYRVKILNKAHTVKPPFYVFLWIK